MSFFLACSQHRFHGICSPTQHRLRLEFLGSGRGRGMIGEWNVCQVRGCGAWWPYKSERVVLGQFRIVGYREVL
jgi:hypothetical protein